MTDSGAAGAAHQSDDADSEVMLTTGEAAEVIGFGTKRKQVIAMIANKQLAYVRTRRGAWAKIPLWAAQAKHRELARALAQSESEVRAQERLKQPEDD